MAHCEIYRGEIFLPNTTTSILKTGHLLSSSIHTVADCALLCLDSALCQAAIFNNQNGTCTMFSENLNTGGQLVPAYSDDVTTIIVEKNIVSWTSFITQNDTVYPVWNVSAGGDSTPALSGLTTGGYWFLDLPRNVFDGNLTTHLNMYGVCNYTEFRLECGSNTGVYVTAPRGPFVLQAFQIATGEIGSSRDPLTITIEGSNQNSSALTLGSSWTLIYNGTSGLSTDPGRSSFGIKQIITNNTLAFASYRFLVLQKRDIETCVEYAEIQFFGS